jgi:hypothetical protein
MQNAAQEALKALRHIVIQRKLMKRIESIIKIHVKLKRCDYAILN